MSQLFETIMNEVDTLVIAAKIRMNNMKDSLKERSYNALHSEQGAVDIVVILLLIAVAVALVFIFRDEIAKLIQKVFGGIDTDEMTDPKTVNVP